MAYCIFESIQKWIFISNIQVIAMNNVNKNCLKTSKQCRKILSKSVKNCISFQCNTRISNSKCSLLCTILCSMLRTSIFVQMYVNTRAGLRAHLSTPVYYYVLHTGQCIVVAGQPRHVSFLNIHGFRPGFMTFNIRMCFATIHNGAEMILKP